MTDGYKPKNSGPMVPPKTPVSGVNIPSRVLAQLQRAVETDDLESLHTFNGDLQPIVDAVSPTLRALRTVRDDLLEAVGDLEGELQAAETERDMWKLEAALWRGDRAVALPDGWELCLGSYTLKYDPSDDGAVFLHACHAMVETGCPTRAVPGLSFRRYKTWHEAMAAAEEAARNA